MVHVPLKYACLPWLLPCTHVAILPCTAPLWLCYHVQQPCGYATMYSTHMDMLPCTTPMCVAMLPCMHPMWLMLPCTVPTLSLCYLASIMYDSHGVCPIVSQPVWHYSKTAIRHLPCRCSFLQPAMNNKTLVFLWATDVLPDKCGHAGQQHAWASQHGPARAVCISVKCTRRATDQHSPSFLPPTFIIR
jgi:hypothetical protein